MKFSLSLAALLLCNVWGVTLDEITTKPASREKNFLIWQYLRQDINATQAAEAFIKSIPSMNVFYSTMPVKLMKLRFDTRQSVSRKSLPI
jgi:hypothetical protein